MVKKRTQKMVAAARLGVPRRTCPTCGEVLLAGRLLATIPPVAARARRDPGGCVVAWPRIERPGAGA